VDGAGPITLNPVPSVERHQLNTTRKQRAFVIGATVSVCESEPYDRNRRFVSVNFEWGGDSKPENRRDDNRMVTVGASYHAVIFPSLTIGSGAGIAWFSSKTADSFEKLYIEPYIIDFRPLALKRHAELAGPWWHVFYIRYNTLTFPKGFEPGRFGGRSPRYPMELIHSIGFHADLEPVIRKLQGKW
jgi:hypothetical protein